MLKLKRTALVALTVTTLGSIAGFAHAGVNSPRDPFTEGAHAMGTRDPYTHGAIPRGRAIRSPMATMRPAIVTPSRTAPNLAAAGLLIPDWPRSEAQYRGIPFATPGVVRF